MVEGVGAALLILLILWACSGKTHRQPRFSIEITQYSGFYEVRETGTGETRFIGTMEQCEKWITEHDK